MADGSREPMLPPPGVRACRLADLWLLCARMRPDEVEQYLAFHHADVYDHEQAAAAAFALPGPKITIADDDGQPILSGGGFEVSPGVYEGWMIGTMDGWANHGRQITRVSRWMMEYLFSLGAHRLQITSLASREDACRWYRQGLRMTAEGIKRGYGKNGEDAIEFSRLRSDP